MRRAAAAIFALLPVLLAAITYGSVTERYFFADDLWNLYRIANEGFSQYVLTPFGGHILLTRNTVFAICFYLFGPDPVGYQQLSVLTHLVNVVLVFKLIRLYTRSAFVACFGAAIWGTLPSCDQTVQWYSVHGQAVATAAILWILCDLGRMSNDSLPFRFRLRWGLLLFVASTSFGTGTAAALSMPIVAHLLLPKTPVRVQVVRFLAVASVAISLLYITVHYWANAEYGAGVEPSLEMSLFSAPDRWERAVTIGLQLLGNGIWKVILGVIPVYAHPSGIRWAVAGIGLFIATCSLRMSPVCRVRIVALLCLAGASYASVAIGRGLLANWMSVSLVAESARYQYFGTMMLSVAFCVAFSGVTASFRPSPRVSCAILAVALAIGPGVHLMRREPLDLREIDRRVVNSTLTSIQQAIEATPAEQDVYIKNPVGVFPPVGIVLQRDHLAFPSWAAIFVIFHPENVVDGKRVYFIEPDARVLEAAIPGSRLATLIVAPLKVPYGAREAMNRREAEALEARKRKARRR